MFGRSSFVSGEWRTEAGLEQSAANSGKASPDLIPEQTSLAVVIGF
jgi:hypothetical protein